MEASTAWPPAPVVACSSSPTQGCGSPTARPWGRTRSRSCASPGRRSAGRGLGVLDDELFFSASEDLDSPDYELWKSDGTPQGTVRVKDIGGEASEQRPPELHRLQGTALLFGRGRRPRPRAVVHRRHRGGNGARRRLRGGVRFIQPVRPDRGRRPTAGVHRDRPGALVPRRIPGVPRFAWPTPHRRRLSFPFGTPRPGVAARRRSTSSTAKVTRAGSGPATARRREPIPSTPCFRKAARRPACGPPTAGW